METVLGYFAQSSLVLIIGYLFYRLVFRSEGYFVFNRFYLLAVLLLSLCLPLIPINMGEYVSGYQVVNSIQNPVQAINNYFLSEVTIQSTIEKTRDSVWLSWEYWFLSVYSLGVLIGLTRLVFRILQLFSLIRSNSKNKVGRLTFVVLDKGTPVFSFLHYVFVSEEIIDFPDRNQQILTHEQQHVRQLHTIDVLFSELAAVVFWFNPFIYLINKEIRENHELLADDTVLSHYPDINQYMVLLFTHSTQMNAQLLTHNFSYSLLKRRLFMMKKPRNPWRFSFKLLWIVPALMLAAFACSNPDSNNQSKANEEFMVNSYTTIPRDSVALQMTLNPTEGVVVFLVSLGKQRVTQLNVFDESGNKVKSLMGDEWGPGTYGITWRPNEDNQPAIGNFSYLLVADDIHIPGNLSFNPDPVEASVDETPIFTVVEDMPSYPGGQGAMMKFLAANIKYPAQAKENGIQGRVFINFVVEADGKVSNVKLLRGIGGGCDEEAIRVVNAMPNWTPGKQDGESVRVSFNLPVKFTLN